MKSTYEAEAEADKRGHIAFQDSKFPINEAALKGRRVVVTGGASGIGEACCRRLAAAGSYVVIADKSEKRGRALEKDIGGERVKYLAIDVASWDSQLEMFTQALEFLPGHVVDVLVTCAAIGSSPGLDLSSPQSKTLHGSSSAERKAIPKPSTACFDVNLTGTIFSIKIATEFCMRATGQNNTLHRSIVILGSTSGFRPLPGKTGYSIAKWGVRGFFRTIRSELPQYGVRVNMMVPFWVPTALTQHLVPTLEKQGLRVGRMEDVLNGIVRMIVDERMNGRAVSVTAKGLEDIDDDLAGQDGGTAMRALVRDGWLSAPKSASLQRGQVNRPKM